MTLSSLCVITKSLSSRIIYHELKNAHKDMAHGKIHVIIILNYTVHAKHNSSSFCKIANVSMLPMSFTIRMHG